MSAQKVGIIGAGFMGRQLAFYLAKSGIFVILIDIAREQLEEAKKQIVYLADQFGVADKVSSLFITTTDLQRSIFDCDLLIECTPENLDLKKRLFAQLAGYCQDGGILATNSSAISVSEIEEVLNDEQASRVLNMHFLPPVWERPLVEIMRGQKTSDEVVTTVSEFVSSIGLVPVVLQKENRGFVFNFIWQAIKDASLDLADRGIASVEDIDTAWRTATGMKAGPFQVMDMVGLDVVEAIFKQHGRAVPKILTDLIIAGKLGQKTGEGFYSYS